MNEHLAQTAEALASWAEAIMTGAPHLAEHIREARIVWLIGNGGSQACAEHWATDFQKVRSRSQLDPIFVAPATNAPQFTMLANDYGYDQAYAHGLVGRMAADVVIALSTSGRSPNLLQSHVDWAIAPEGTPLCTQAVRAISGPPYRPGVLEDVFSILGHAITEELRP